MLMYHSYFYCFNVLCSSFQSFIIYVLCERIEPTFPCRTIYSKGVADDFLEEKTNFTKFFSNPLTNDT